VDRAGADHGIEVAQRKMQRADFKALLQHVEAQGD